MISISYGNFPRLASPHLACCHAPHQNPPANPWAGYVTNCQCQQSGQALQQAWTGLLTEIDSRPQSPQGVSEIGRNQTFQAGDKNIQVDGKGTVQVDQQGHLHGLLAAFSQSSPGNGTSQGAAFLGSVSPSQQLKFENGNISLPNGKKIPFGNCGAIVVMADGSQVGAGRNSENSSEQIRTAYAGPGEKIPTSPPGKTNVYHLNEAGDIVRQDVV